MPFEDDSPLQTAWPDRPAGEPPKRRSALSFFKELPVLILIAFGLALLIKTFLIQAFYIPSESMLPTLLVKDRVLVNKLVYRFREPRRGEVIVFVAERDEAADRRSFLGKVFGTLTEGLGLAPPPDRDFIKRIIGLPGETVEMKDGVVYVTPKGGKRFALTEPYLADQRDLTPFGPTKVPEGSYFVMGDNRPNSADSRTRLGPIKRSDIVGKAFVKIWPVGRAGLLKAPSYAPAVAFLPLVGAVRRRRAA